jgi:membrane protein DedA with SNARE-associated domain
MRDLVSAIGHHGYLVIFLVVLAEAVGLPMPAALALVVGGAAAASHTLRAPMVVAVAMIALALGDSLLYLLGRSMGWRLLGLLCKVSANPETCILRSAESFYKRGKATLLLAKFVPGVNTMAPPLAGSMKMRYEQFLGFDLAGAALYTLAYGTLGYVFRDFVASITHGFQTAQQVVGTVVLGTLVGFIAYRVYLFSRHRLYQVVPRVQAEELARKLGSEPASKILIVDVRSHGYYDSGADRIRGSIRIEPNNLSEELKTLPRDKDIYVYCT